MDFVPRLIVAACIVLASAFACGAHAQTGSATAMTQCQSYAATTVCWALQSSPCRAVQCNRGNSEILAQCPGSQNGGVTCSSSLATIRRFPYQFESCNLAAGTETARGINASGLPDGAAGCDRDTNCATTFQRTDEYTVGGNSFAGGRFVTTGQTCNVPADEPDDSEDVEDTHCENQGNLLVCVDDDEICVTAPSGRKYCWGKDSNPDAGCDHDSDDALCRDSNPPPRQDGRDDWRRDAGPVDVQNNGNTTTYTSHTNRPDRDNDGDNDDDDGDDDNDGAGDGDDDEEAERTASLTGCGSQPSCDGDPIDCAHYITSWRHRCDADDDATSGGAQCSAPPSCTGDPIQCAQLSQLWRLRCDFDGSVTGGRECDAEPTCKGDPLRCAIVRQQWLMRCRASDVSGGETCNAPPSCTGDEAQCALVEASWRGVCQGQVSGGGSCATPPTCDASSSQCVSVRALWRMNCVISDTTGRLPTDDEMFGDAGTPGQGVVTSSSDWIASIDQTGWGLSRSCPLIQTASFGSAAIAMPAESVCGVMSIFGLFVMLAGVMHAIYILGRS